MKNLFAKWPFVVVLSLTAFMLVLHTSVSGQGKKTKKDKHKYHHNWSGPSSGERVYFPDYYTFYDPIRHGYVYWQESKWIVSPEKPFFMKDADLGKTRVQVLKNDQLAMPEDHFEQYMRLYPAQQVSPSVPVPIITISKQKR